MQNDLYSPVLFFLKYIIGMGSIIAEYTPIIEIVPQRRTASTAWYKASNRSTPLVWNILAAAASGKRPAAAWANLPYGDP
jgi:hypothetical protein